MHLLLRALGFIAPMAILVGYLLRRRDIELGGWGVLVASYGLLFAHALRKKPLADQTNRDRILGLALVWPFVVGVVFAVLLVVSLVILLAFAALGAQGDWLRAVHFCAVMSAFGISTALSLPHRYAAKPPGQQEASED